MTITPEQREARRHSLGGSDMPILAGYTGNPYDLWLEKVHRTEPWAGNEQTKIGDDFEGAMVKWVSTQIDDPIYTTPRRLNKCLLPDFPFHANLDGLIEETNEGVEVKITGKSHLWGTPGTDQVPKPVVVQSTWNCGIFGLKGMHVAVLLPGHGGLERRLYYVPFEVQLYEALTFMGQSWWDKYVVPRVPPTNHGPPSEATVKRVVRVPDKVAYIDDDICEAYDSASQALSRTKTLKEELKAELLAELDDAEIGFAPGWVVEYPQIKPKGKKPYRKLSVKRREETEGDECESVGEGEGVD